MKLTVCIFTTSKPQWFSRELADIQKVVAEAKGGGIEKYDIQYFKPPQRIPTKKYKDGAVKPDWLWFKDTFTDKAKGYNVVVFHCTEKERNRWGVSRTIGGTYSRDDDEVMEFWFCADKGDDAKHYKKKSEFWRRFLHELSHGHERFLYGKETEITHHYDYDLHAIQDVYKTYDWTTWDALQKTRNSLLSKIVNFVRPTTMKPLPQHFWDRVTQHFGVPSDMYPATKTHMGTDFGCPTGTPVYAPQDGEYVITGTTKTVGNYGVYRFNNRDMRLCHLYEVPKKGKYKKGDVIAHTGNTGMSTGPHLHIDLWKSHYNMALIDSRESVFRYLEDPYKVL
jgi:hypothetical protein